MRKLASLLDPVRYNRLQQERFSLYYVMYYIGLVGLAAHTLFLILFLLSRIYPLALYNIVSLSVFGIGFWLNLKGRSHFGVTLGISEIVVHAVLATIYLGWNSGYHYYILALTPTIFYSEYWPFKLKLSLSGLVAAVYIGLYVYALRHLPLVPMSALYLNASWIMNTVFTLATLGCLAYYYRKAAITLIHANAQLDILAHTDPLTRLANRRGMLEAIAAEMEKHQVTQRAFGLVLGDIDYFKSYNDRYGHKCGDEILIRVAQILREELRLGDLVARWGGEEFLILLPNTHLEEAHFIAERLREKIAGTPILAGLEPLILTMTFGVACSCGNTNPNECILQADGALYRGKQLGRNRVEIAAG